MSHCTHTLLSPHSFLFLHFPPLSRDNRTLAFASPSKWPPRTRPLTLSLARAATYGGWDDPGDSDRSGEEFRLFLASLGIDDRKQIFMFLLGLLCALAISRVRVSSIVVFPASVLVFAVGFSFGLVRGSGESRNREKIENPRVYADGIRRLGKILDDFSINARNLKLKVEKALDSRQVQVSDLEDYARELESIASSASGARDLVETCKENLPNRRKKALREIGFEFLQSVQGLFGENVVRQKSAVAKNFANNVEAGTSVSYEVEDVVESPVNGNEQNIELPLSRDSLNELSFDENGDRKVRKGGVKWKDVDGYSKGFSNGREYRFREKRMQSRNNRSQTETWESRDNLLESVNFSVRMEHTESEASFLREQKVERSSYRSRHKSENIADTSDDAVFDRYLEEASRLLAQAKEFMRDEDEKERAEIILNRCAQLLSKGVALKPESLLAVGQLGNTYLLHGELKLRISRELRDLLLRQINGNDDIASTLVNVCEECEELLMEAGRKYRAALSIDGNDPRALYNWGLALTFRAQLISDIGPEAAFEADKVFLAAIDKFDAMMSKGSVYAPDALYRWGVILQQRSHLRPVNSKEKVKLLNQAKSLYEDALDISSNNVQVREALSTCIFELSNRRF